MVLDPTLISDVNEEEIETRGEFTATAWIVTDAVLARVES
jgi:hypothetical protein